MALTVLSAVIAVDTRFEPDYHLKDRTVDDKCGFLEQCAKRAARKFDELCLTGVPQDTLKFLLAPEYFFGVPLCDKSSAVNAYSDAERARIEGRCGQISRKYPIYSCFPAHRSTKSESGAVNAARLHRN